MRLLSEEFDRSPELARFLPLFIFVLVFALGGILGADGKYWMYAAKTFVGVWLIWEMHPYAAEMRWAFSWEAVIVGIAVFVLWVGVDPYFPKNHIFFKPTPDDVWNPLARFGEGSVMGWAFVIVRIAGSTLVVPPLEEVFYRSFLYRYFVRINFRALPLGTFHVTSFIVTSAIFGFMHYEWFAGILCGMAFQWLVIRKNRLGDAMLAHGITNFLLGVWIVWRGDWQFW
jgi:CAAX prenyl protease-like protein